MTVMKPHCCDWMVRLGCRPGGNTKAFKGKGLPSRQVRQLATELAQVRAQMRQLKLETRTMRVRQFALEIHVKAASGAMMLHWRMARGQHAVWERDIAPLLPRFPVELQAWYRKLHRQVQILNVEERCLRYVHHALKRLTERLRE